MELAPCLALPVTGFSANLPLYMDLRYGGAFTGNRPGSSLAIIALEALECRVFLFNIYPDQSHRSFIAYEAK